MLNFASPLTNEDPYADADHYEGIGTWYWALLLVIGNTAGVPLLVITYKTGFYFLFSIAFASMIVSMFYHLCQTTNQCVGYILFQWVQSDHVTATALMAYFLFFFFVSRSTKQILKTREKNRIRGEDGLKAHRVNDPHYTLPKIPTSTDGGGGGGDTVHEIHFHEENMIYDAFSSSSVVAIFVFIVLQVIAHPFSYHAFINVLTFTLLLGLFKYAVIDECVPKNLKGRLSWPELIIGIFLALIGLTCYVLDSYTTYEVLHTLWHIFIYLALYFLFIGLIRNTPHFYSYWKFIYDGTFRCFRCCTPAPNSDATYYY